MKYEIFYTDGEKDTIDGYLVADDPDHTIYFDDASY